MSPLQGCHSRTVAIAGTGVNRPWGTFLPGNRLDNQHGSYCEPKVFLRLF